jgi:branched-chain amino acid aminotransferase
MSPSQIFSRVGSASAFASSASSASSSSKNGLCVVAKRCVSSEGGLDSSRLEVGTATPSQLKAKPAVKDLVFGKNFTDHLLRATWTAGAGWGAPRITPFENFSIHPAAKVLHYAQELFEGMKAYRGVDDKIRMFRPMHNMARMNVTAKRACLPPFEGTEFLQCIRKLIQIDQEWVPHDTSSSLYIRPTLIGLDSSLGVASATEAELFVLLCPVGPYYATGLKPVNLLADPNYIRAWPGGCGFAKMGSNYAPTLWIGEHAAKVNCQQVLWLFGPDHEVTEVGAMNVFAFLENATTGRKELVTPPLDKGIILPGVTRRSIVEMTSEWGEFDVTERKLTMPELMEAKSEGRLLEMFGSGTAAIVSPIGGIYYEGKMESIPTPERGLAHRVMDSMTDIYYGRISHPWAVDIEDWKVDANQSLKDYDQARTNTEAVMGS